MPYVDLVNEVLENAVAPPVAFVPYDLLPPSGVTLGELEADLNSRQLSDRLCNAFDPPLSPDAAITVSSHGQPSQLDARLWSVDEPEFTYTVRKHNGQLSVVSRSLQTKGTAAERAATPQYLNRAAYDVLRKQVHPWTAPFDLWSEQVRAYLGHLGVARHELMEAFLPGDPLARLNNPAIARESLGLTSNEAAIITGATTGQPGAISEDSWNLWGFEAESLTPQTSIPDPADSTKRIASGQWLQRIRGRVDVFLQQSGLELSRSARPARQLLCEPHRER